MTEITGETSDGFHTFNELYSHRMLLSAALFREWKVTDRVLAPALGAVKLRPHKSWRHSDGQSCGEAFGGVHGSWFIVVANLPEGQISYHYEGKYWDLFNIPERPVPAEYDGHTADDVLFRLKQFLS